MEDKEIVEKILNGEKKYFENLVEKYKNELYVFIYRLCLNNAIAEEILQQTFLKAYKYLDKYDKTKKIKNWLYMIARNCYYDFIKKENKIKLVSMEDISFFVNLNAKTEEEALSNHNVKNILKKIYSLPPKYAEILILRFTEEKTYEEIAEILDIPLGTVKIRIHRAKEKLKKILTEGEDDL